MSSASSATVGAAPHDGLPLVDYEREPGAATAPLPREYKRREPEQTALYAIVRDHLETFLARPTLRGGLGYPAFVEREFRRYLDCGLLCRGFSRLRCAECGFERLVAYSCKGRLCPSCLARRTNDTAARLVDRLLPAVPYRQWVLSSCRAGMRQCRPRQGWRGADPFDLRFALARQPALHGHLVGAFLRIVFAWQRHRGRQLGIVDGQTGSVTLPGPSVAPAPCGGLPAAPPLRLVASGSSSASAARSTATPTRTASSPTACSCRAPTAATRVSCRSSVYRPRPTRRWRR